jgi:hypothetical protein
MPPQRPMRRIHAFPDRKLFHPISVDVRCDFDRNCLPVIAVEGFSLLLAGTFFFVQIRFLARTGVPDSAFTDLALCAQDTIRLEAENLVRQQAIVLSRGCQGRERRCGSICAPRQFHARLPRRLCLIHFMRSPARRRPIHPYSRFAKSSAKITEVTFDPRRPPPPKARKPKDHKPLQSTASIDG